jgi:hypothetical protein
VWHEVIRTWLAPYEASGRVKVLLEHSPIGAEVSGDRVQSVTFAARDGTKVVARAELILDATELGDLYPLAAIEHAIGAEHRNEYGEMHARTDASGRSDPMDQQAISWCFAMEHRPGENHVISRPARYDFWRAYVPKMDPPWTGPLFSWRIPSHDAPGWRELNMVPAPDEPKGGAWELWRYRRIRDAKIHAEPEKHPDVCLVNWVQMDYWLKPLLGVSPAEQQQALAEAREQSLCLFYWMQTEVPRHDGGTGYPGLRLAGETLGTADGFAKAAYIREPRRLLARTIVTERHIGTEQREAEGLGRAVPGHRGHRALPPRPAPEHGGAKLDLRARGALPHPDGVAHPPARAERPRGGQGHRRHAHHQLVLSHAPRRMEHRRVGRHARGVLPGQQVRTPRGARRPRARRRGSARAGGQRRTHRLALGTLSRPRQRGVTASVTIWKGFRRSSDRWPA